MEGQMISKKYIPFLMGIFIFLGLYLTSLYHYLLFHSLAEIFSITIACGIFMIAWNSRQFIDNNYLLFIGIAYLFVAGVDLIHTLAYKGMGVFEGYETNLATQLWIATRYMVSLSLLIAPVRGGAGEIREEEVDGRACLWGYEAESELQRVVASR